MSTFPLRIGTPDGLLFEGDVERVVCRSVGGDLAILATHCNLPLVGAKPAWSWRTEPDEQRPASAECSP